jgi:D-erythronate 2-dehydrogenase
MIGRKLVARLATDGALGGREIAALSLADVTVPHTPPEVDFDKGYRANLDGARALFGAIRAVGDGYRPRVVFTSSMAAYGAPFPDAIGDEFIAAPLTSYGTQKVMAELMLADYSRRGFMDGIAVRLPNICIRPGMPNKADGVCRPARARAASDGGGTLRHAGRDVSRRPLPHEG